jgi:c-di-GMP-binding flagellar brake protein YcgR
MKKAKKSKTTDVMPSIQNNRRREWRLDLPLPAEIEGQRPKGKKFKESTTIKNISAGGAYFSLDSGLAVGSKLNLVISLPKKLTEGKVVKLNVGGITVRLEPPDVKGKRQGVAIRFDKDFRFIESSGKKKPS